MPTRGYDADVLKANYLSVLTAPPLEQHDTPGPGELYTMETSTWMHNRFVARAHALFYGRMVFLTLGLLILSVPAWREYFDLSPLAFGWYFFMLLYSAASYLFLKEFQLGSFVTYLTLCFDLTAMIVVVLKPEHGGGLGNPLLVCQLLFSIFFSLLYPKPLAILPPLLVLPIVAQIDGLFERRATGIEMLTLACYLSLNFIIIYVLMYLNACEVSAHRKAVALQTHLKTLAVVEERSRLSRDIHDGLGSHLASIIIQSEYAMQMACGDAAIKELKELKTSAEESIEELRRSVQLMHGDFDMGSSIESYVKTFSSRTHLEVSFVQLGDMPRSLSAERALALFRMLQESLSNACKHARAAKVLVQLNCAIDVIALSVKDDGIGFDPKHSCVGHYGLMNMRERAIKLGGELQVDSSPGQGAEVIFSVPST